MIRSHAFASITCLAVALVAGCVDVEIDEDETADNLPLADGPLVEFDPSNRIIPLPNSLLIEDGTVEIPEQCGESATAADLRENVLNQLDGFGTNTPLGTVTTTRAVNLSSLGNRFRVYERIDEDGNEIDPLIADTVPTTVLASLTQRFDDNCENPTLVTNLTFFPEVPLDDQSVYSVVILDGLRDESGDDFLPSPTWALVRQEDNPVTFDESGALIAESTPLDPLDPDDLTSLTGIDRLWNALNPTVDWLVEATGESRDDFLIAWDFRTQTIEEPLEAEVEDSPASELPTTTPLLGSGGTPGMDVVADQGGTPVDVEDFINGVTDGACAQLPCAAIDTVYSGAVLTNNYQVNIANPLGSNFAPLPGAWPDPYDPALDEMLPVTVTAFKPASAAPEGGYPVIIFGHGITRSRFDVFAVAPQLAASGFAVITLDWVGHGDPDLGGRAVQIDDTSPQCLDSVNGGDGPDPTDRDNGGITCFAPFFDTNLAATRDNLRQSVLDALALVNALKTCSGDTCGTGFTIDAGKIGFLGHSLGGILGTIITAMGEDVGAAVVNVAGVGFATIIEETEQRLLLQCPLVDALIESGVIPGEPLDLENGTGTCLGDDWKLEPGWLRFANTARWILDPADGINYLEFLIGRAVLVQEVVGDETVPNEATELLTGLLGLPAVAAAVEDDGAPSPTVETATGAGSLLHIEYSTVSTPAPGNTFDHGSLLAPPDDSGTAGAFGTLQMQTDAITYLCTSLGAACSE